VARVLITGFCSVPGASRAGVQLRHVVRALSADHSVDLLVIREADQAYVERQGNVRVLRVPGHDPDLRSQVQGFQRALRRQLDGADYDVVHCRDGWSCRTVLEPRGHFGYAVVFDLSRAPWVDATTEPELAAELDRDADHCIAAADLVLVPTEPARRYAVARAKPDRVAVSPPGVDVDRFDWDLEPADDPPRILYAGSLEPGRGIRTLLRAMCEVIKSAPARLVLAGPMSPGFHEPLAAAIRDLGLGDHVDIEPPADHDTMPRLIATATVCVVPAAPDLVPRATALYPTKLLEYMACRRAVVAPRRGTVAMLIDHGREGMLFAPSEPGDLARKILRLLQDPDLRVRMAHHGYERVRREFTASSARRALRAAYQQLGDRPQFRARFQDNATGSAIAVSRVAARDLSASDPAAGDDEFEATVFEGPPSAPGDDSGDSMPGLESALEALDADARTGDSHPVTEEREIHAEETAERVLQTGAGPARQVATRRKFGVDSNLFTVVDSTGPNASPITDEWVVRAAGGDPSSDVGLTPAPTPTPTRIRAARDRDEDGTPVDVEVEAVAMPEGPPPFAAGEIDVPTPPPELIEVDGAFTAASTLLGPRVGEADPGDLSGRK